VTCDDRQKTREGEAKALHQAGLTALWFGPFWSKKQFWDQARWVINRWPTIDGYAKSLSEYYTGDHWHAMCIFGRH
jgi:hypothetical protein